MPYKPSLPRLTAVRRRLLDRLLGRLLELEVASRSRELEAMAVRAPRIHRWLVELLTASTESTLHLKTLFRRVGQAADREVRSRQELSLASGVRLGPWCVGQSVGTGGMGTVYRAERADGAFAMQAAIKLIRVRRKDLDERLKLERELLARLDHRNIARLIDGGTTDEGQAYLVMEWVEGLDLDEYLRRVNPNRAERLDLFEQVARAVAHAHRRRVIHGDLKPANVRVNDHGEVRLLDFGIARLAEVESEIDQSFGRAMTPAFSAPEQLRGEPVSTLSDVWSLGVLLAWILSGRLPDCQRPVAALLPADLPDRKDFAAIVAVSCAEDPEQRYDGVPQLLDDVERARQYRPVRARASTRRYLLSRFLQRHRLAVAGSAAACLAVVLALAGALWQWQVAGTERDRAEIQRDRAELEAERSQDVSDFLVGLFEHADPGIGRGEVITAQQLLQAGINRVGQLDGQPGVQSRMYRVLARVQMNLGEYDSAEELARAALAVEEEAGGGHASEAMRLLVQLGNIHLQKGEPQEALEYFRRGLAKSESTESELEVEALLGIGGALLNAGGRLEEAIEVLGRALVIGRRVVPDTPLVAAVHNNLGGGAYYDGRFDDAARHFERAIHLLVEHFGTDHPRVFFSQTNLAFLFMEQGRYPEAEAVLVGLIEAQERTLGAQHPHHSANLHTMGSLHWRQGRAEQAIGWWKRAMAARVAAFGEKHPDVAATQNALALALASRGDLEEAEALYSRALSTLQDPGTARTVRLPATLSNLADLRFVQGRHNEALRLHQQVLDLRLELLGSGHPHIGISQRKIASVHLTADRTLQAREWAGSSLRTLQTAYEHGSHPEIGKTEALIKRIDARVDGRKERTGP